MTASAAKDQRRHAERIFRTYQMDVFGICYYYMRDRQDCLDTTMDVFTAFLDKQAAGEEIRNVKGWLLTVAKNLSLKELRSKSRLLASEISERDLMEYAAETEPIHDEGREEMLISALEQLKDEQRRCIELFYLNQKSYKDIQQITGWEYNFIKSYIQNGKRKLRILISEMMTKN